MIETSTFRNWLTALLAETFGVADAPGGFFLESSHSGLFPVLDGLTAEVASAVYPPETTTIAAYCGHIQYILSWFLAYSRGEAPAADWEGSWASASVDDAAWDALRGELRSAYAALALWAQEREDWSEPPLAASMILLTHCAYHVGQIRQLLTFVAARP